MGEPKSEPQGLKPFQFESLYGTTEVVPFPKARHKHARFSVGGVGVGGFD